MAVQGEQEIWSQEAQLRQAMLGGDVGALDALLSDDLVFTDQAGRLLTKQDDLAAHRSRLLRIERLDTGDTQIRLLGDTAIVTLKADVQGQYGGQAFGGAFAYTRIWVRAGQGWRIAAAHCSEIAQG
ncbi:MAG: hypothetical protein JWN66_832 [Sphingomonas bacterium]|uniref:nuclear transport factor 2 family protein n=1 Tax=Sphingomonas bacterium TaxID=1895847 RepID=UPI00262C9B07|nr:nuclear transport factor 2 family protein [Sphingomonas bacterium]MDB5703716.1 hypothetical protein [Sphingomonas bacterium]